MFILGFSVAKIICQLYGGVLNCSMMPIVCTIVLKKNHTQYIRHGR